MFDFLFARKRARFSRVYFAVLLILTWGITFSVNGFQNTDTVDSTFNPQIQTTAFLSKNVYQLIELPDGKILAAGNFNNYNGTPVGALIRLNSDASLDAAFNNDLLEVGTRLRSIKLQPDGKILIVPNAALKLTNGDTYTNPVIRLNENGTVDSSFNYSYTGMVYEISVDAGGRVLLSGTIQIPENGGFVEKNIIRLKGDGTIDLSFNASIASGSNVAPNVFATQNSKILYIRYDAAAEQSKLYRLNENGANDTSFTPTLLGSYSFYDIKIQSDDKILVLSNKTVIRINENGGDDPSFQAAVNFTPGDPRKILLHGDGRMTIAYSAIGKMIIIRLLPNGSFDPSFTQYTQTGDIIGHTVLQNGSVIIGDQSELINSNNALNRFIRLLPNGLVDSAFNTGKSGFLNIRPGKISAISVLGDDKILIGGDFDQINNIDRKRIARLNADSSLDTSFQINTGTTGNYFSQIKAIYHFAVQSDGRIIVSGNFFYFVNGVQKRNLVRLNADGGIDATFVISLYIDDASDPAPALGDNKPLLTSEEKILIGTTRRGYDNSVITPLLLTTVGAKESSFNPTIFNTKFVVSILDIALQSDGKILIAGRHVIPNINGDIQRGFIARLNSDGTVDESFHAEELADKDVSAVKVLQNNQILIVSRTNLQNTISRLNADGSLDGSFDGGTGTNGKINDVSVLPNNKILVAGAFTTYNAQPRQNLAMLNADGTLAAGLENINREVLCITVDKQGRVLIGGHFTSISAAAQSSSISAEAGNFSSINEVLQQVTRSYLARLIITPEETRPTNFDFDGDGKSDFSIYRPDVGQWWYLRSSDGNNRAFQFGTETDVMTPGDYTGDGKSDFAFYRPSNGVWYILRSEDGSYYGFPFGIAEDIPVPADYDGDGKTDAAVYRPSTNVWYILNSTGGVTIKQFGENGSIPIPGDYTGDGKADFAYYNAATQSWSVWNVGGIYLPWQQGQKPVPADYTGDGKTDYAFYASGKWWVRRSENRSIVTTDFGTVGDIPAPADYDGDGKTDYAVYRPSTGVWWYAASSANGQHRATQFGISTDKPVPNAYIR